MGSETDNGELVPHVPNVYAGLVASMDMGIRDLPSTLPRDEAGLKRRFNAMGQSSLEMGRDGTVLITVVDVLAYWVNDHEDENGELKSFSMLVLIDPDGQTFATSSPVVAAKIGMLAREWMLGTIKRPTDVEVVTRTGRRSGRRFHDVVLI